ncbi:MAG TPA: hypothetical protein DCE52_09255, partial [Rhodobacteraceae bacterium]|nr:hypothetical protein [Paracoccaceae bacterium]
MHLNSEGHGVLFEDMSFPPYPSTIPTLGPVPETSPSQTSQGDTHLTCAGAGVVPSMQPRHEFVHGPQAVALCGRQGAHEGLDLLGQGGVALDASVTQALALCSPDGLFGFKVGAFTLCT